jgi:amidohydrolase
LNWIWYSVCCIVKFREERKGENVMNNRLNGLDELLTDMIHWRRYLHENPELSFQEQHTSAFIAECLHSFGVEMIQGSAGYAVFGRIMGTLSGPTVALRADMDALPIQDEKLCAYSSKVPGVMHACGHDAHTAILLGLAKWFSTRRELISGQILFIFQHAEEVCPGGAIALIESGVLQEVDVIYGVHLWTPFPVGHVYTRPGAMMAAPDEFHIEITGKGGHGGLPHDTVDSILIGSHMAVNLQTIISRSIDPTTPSVLSIGAIQAGHAFNVIAEACTMKGTVRTFDDQTRDRIRSRMASIVEETAKMFGGEATLHYQEGYPSLVNDTTEADRFFSVAPTLFPEDRVKLSPLIMAGEDFAHYLHHMPGCYMFVGAGNPEQGKIYPHHHPKFDIDEEALLHASRLLAGMALNYMERPTTAVNPTQMNG